MFVTTAKLLIAGSKFPVRNLKKRLACVLLYYIYNITSPRTQLTYMCEQHTNYTVLMHAWEGTCTTIEKKNYRKFKPFHHKGFSLSNLAKNLVV